MTAKHGITNHRVAQRCLQGCLGVFIALLLLAGNAWQMSAANTGPVGRATASLNQALPFTFSPVKGRYTSAFGQRKDPITGQAGKFHAGLDIAAPSGSPIIAPQAGLVVFSGEKSGYGKVVVVQHHPMFHTLYAHASRLIAKRGDVVTPGQVLGLVGSTGRSTGDHLHFETILNKQYTNPLNYLAFLEQNPPVNTLTYKAAVAHYTANVDGNRQGVKVAHLPRVGASFPSSMAATQAPLPAPLPLQSTVNRSPIAQPQPPKPLAPVPGL